MPYDINGAVKKAEKDYGLGKGEYYKVQEGPNKIRVMSHFEPHQGNFNGNPTFKLVAWIIDRRDGTIKPYFMPLKIVNLIGALQADPEYAFEDMPMPYDITINAKNAGKMEVEYQVTAARQNTPVTAAELAALSERMPIEEYVAKIREKDAAKIQSSTNPFEGVDNIEVSDPFANVESVAPPMQLGDEPTVETPEKPVSKFAQAVAAKTGGKYGA